MSECLNFQLGINSKSPVEKLSQSETSEQIKIQKDKKQIIEIEKYLNSPKKDVPRSFMDATETL